MKKELEDRLYALGSHKGGRLLRMAFAISEGKDPPEARDEIGRSEGWWYQLDRELRDEVIEVGRLLSIERVVDAQEQGVTVLKDATVEAAEELVELMRHARNSNVRLRAATAILDRVGVDHTKTIRVEGDMIDLPETIMAAIDKVWGEDEEVAEEENGTGPDVIDQEAA